MSGVYQSTFNYMLQPDLNKPAFIVYTAGKNLVIQTGNRFMHVGHTDPRFWILKELTDAVLQIKKVEPQPKNEENYDPT